MSHFRNDLRGFAALSLTYRGGPWRIRTEVGTGLVWSHILHAGSGSDFGGMAQSGDWIGVALDVSLRVGRQLTDQVSLGVAPTGTWFGGAQWESGDSTFAPSKAVYGVLVDLSWGI